MSRNPEMAGAVGRGGVERYRRELVGSPSIQCENIHKNFNLWKLGGDPMIYDVHTTWEMPKNPRGESAPIGCTARKRLRGTGARGIRKIHLLDFRNIPTWRIAQIRWSGNLAW